MTSVLFTYLPDAGKLNWGGRDRRVLGALHHAPQVFRASLMRGKSSWIWYGVMRPYTGPLKNILILWYIGDGWGYELRLYLIKGEKHLILGKISSISL